LDIFQKLCRDDQAASMAEYAIVLSVVAAGALVAMANFDGVVTSFREVTIDLANVTLPEDPY
jgi:Flp pilus assembly pilin Flp